MEENLITFETAVLAKEKGFDILTHSYYFEDGEFKENSLIGTNGYYGEDYEFNLAEFNENWNNKWLTKKSGDRCFGCTKDRGYFETFSAPTQSLLQKYLREVHKIDVEAPLVYKLNTREYLVRIYKNNTEIILSTFHYYKTYEEGLEEGLKQALKLI